MRSLLFFLLAGCAVRSDDNNYYVVQVLDDPPIQTKKPFDVYWNVPTMQCASKRIRFENLYEKFGIIQNDRDRFKGEKITILYDPGLFPALFKNETSGKFRFRNGGVPQEGDLNKHLDAFKRDLEHSVPDEDFSGVGIIDFESWRPVFRQNFGELRPYKDVSIQIERELHWWWQKEWLEAEAKRRFEEAARTYMESTLAVAKRMRPLAAWGFYGFPYCFNMAANNMVESCANNVPHENDRVPWLWAGSTALFPSVYRPERLPRGGGAALVRGRVREAARVARAPPILPYFWFRYRDGGFLSQTDLNVALVTLYQSKTTGFIIWGSSNDVNTVAKCTKLLDYVENVLGPAVAKYTLSTRRHGDHDDNATIDNNSTTENPIFNDTSFINSNTDLDTELHWTPPENYTEDIKTNVETEMKRKLNKNATKDDDTVLQNNNILIDLILNTVLNNVDNVTSTDSPKTKQDKKSQPEHVVSTTEINVEDKPAETSHDISNVVTKNPLANETINNNTDQQLGLHHIDNISTESMVSDETTTVMTSTTTDTTFQNPDTSRDDFESHMSSDSLYDTSSTEKSNSKEYDYDATSDEDDDYVLNYDVFTNNDSETTTVYDHISTPAYFATDLKNDKKIHIYTTEDYLITENVDTITENIVSRGMSSQNGSLTDASVINNEKSSTERINEDLDIYTKIDSLTEKTSSELFVTKEYDILSYMPSDTMETSSTVQTTLADEISIKDVELREIDSKILKNRAINKESDETNSRFVPTEAYVNESQTPETSITQASEPSIKEPLHIVTSPGESDLLTTQPTEPTTTLIAPTSEQVANN